MLPSLDYSNERFGRLEEPFRVNFGLLIAAELLSPHPLDVAGRADEVEAVCRHEALRPLKGWRHAAAPLTPMIAVTHPIRGGTFPDAGSSRWHRK